MKLSELIKNIDLFEEKLAKCRERGQFCFYFSNYAISCNYYDKQYKLEMNDSKLKLILCRFYDPSGKSTVLRCKERLLEFGFIDDLATPQELMQKAHEVVEEAKKHDAVNHPSHYTQGKVECIDAIESACINKQGIEAVCVANVIKYLWRYESKNCVEDVKKARWYLERLIEELEK